MSTDDRTPEPTQDEPVMAGATEATEQEKQDGRQEQIDADAHRDRALDDDVRSIHAVGEDRGASHE